MSDLTACQEIAKLTVENERLRGMLCRTADGQFFGNGSKVYYLDPTGYVQGLDVRMKFCTDSSVPETVYHPFPVYSSEEAARR